MASLGRTARRKRGRVDGIRRRRIQGNVDDIGAMVRDRGAWETLHHLYRAPEWAGKRSRPAQVARMWARAVRNGERVVVAHGGGMFVGNQARWQHPSANL